MKNILVLLSICCLLNISQTEAQTNLALNLDGTNDYVKIPNSPDINYPLNQDFTVEAYIKVPATPQTTLLVGDNDIIEKWDNVGGYPYVIRYNNGLGTITAGRYNNSTLKAISTTMTVNDNAWHHYAFVKSGATLYLYVDGVLDVTTADYTSGTTSNNSPLFLGRRGGGDDRQFFKGELDEVRIWNVARTQAEIAANKNCPLSGNESGLMAYYSFDNPSATAGGSNAGQTTLADNSGNGNTGTLNDFALSGATSNWVTGQPNCASAIPTLSEWGLIIFALLLLCTGAVAVWRGRYGKRTVSA